jgi:hypothetical protein
MAELQWVPAIQAAEIDVGVKDGVVTLSGDVECTVRNSRSRGGQAGVRRQGRRGSDRGQAEWFLDAHRRGDCPVGKKHARLEFLRTG